jgi:uncharacterized protein YdcH (DUF465 family)
LPSIDRLVRRLPRHEFSIWRLYVRDPEFRSVCDDYNDVHHALERWQTADQALPERVGEYCQMLEELEVEVLAMLRAREDT